MVKYTEEDIKKWAEHVASFCIIDIKLAEKIARERIIYLEKSIEKLEIGQRRQWKANRAKLLKLAKKKRPLRELKFAEEVLQILAARNRHKYTDYDERIREMTVKAAQGKIKHKDIKMMAMKARVRKKRNNAEIPISVGC